VSEIVVAARPVPGTPRPYVFPPFERRRLANGLSLLSVDLPGRPLLSAQVVFRYGAADEPAADGGATVLAARALSEGTRTRDAIELVESAERWGASLHAEAGWDAVVAGVTVPAARLTPALELLAEMILEPAFPGREVDRLRDERLNDLLQARADPRRRAEETFAATIYRSSPYGRPAGGTSETVARLTRDSAVAAWSRWSDPGRATLIVGGDLSGIDVEGVAVQLFGAWRPHPEAALPVEVPAASAIDARFVRLVHRPGSVQSEIRIGHPGVPRRIPDFHALSVMSAILGGLFNSRLNMKLREEKGYTYGASAGFDLRRSAGPFGARAAVNTDVTVPAITDMLAELDRIRQGPVAPDELRAARDFLVGIFPLRFETPGAVVGALAGLVTHDLPDDELNRYRSAIEAVTVDQVLAAARAHIDPDGAAIVVVGDADQFGSELEAAGFGPVVVERDETAPAARGPLEGVEDDLGPVDEPLPTPPVEPSGPAEPPVETPEEGGPPGDGRP
jgi:predicted Zn-dependent peptidase